MINHKKSFDKLWKDIGDKLKASGMKLSDVEKVIAEVRLENRLKKQTNSQKSGNGIKP